MTRTQLCSRPVSTKIDGIIFTREKELIEAGDNKLIVTYYRVIWE